MIRVATGVMRPRVGACRVMSGGFMASKSCRKTNSDTVLMTWWREWLKAFDAEMSARDEREEQRRHKQVELIQRTIARTPSQGLVGIGIKLALANFLDGFCDDAGGETAVSAYFDTRQMLGRDFVAEAEAIIERVRQRGSVVAEYC